MAEEKTGKKKVTKKKVAKKASKKVAKKASKKVAKKTAEKTAAKKPTVKKTAAKKTTAEVSPKPATTQAVERPAAGAGSGRVNVTLKRSLNRRTERHKACVRGLGLRRIGQTVSVADTPENRGMIRKVNYLLSVEEA